MSKWIIRVIILLGFFGLLIIPAGVSAATVGTQEFFLPLPSNITQDIFKTITPEEWGDPGGDEYMHYVVGVVATADNTKVYYDQWENGYLNGAAGDSVTTREGASGTVITLNRGQTATFESVGVGVPSNPRGSGTYYDAGDRIYAVGGPLQIVVSTWGQDLGTVLTDAWEVYPLQVWETSYVIPVGDNLANIPPDYQDFQTVWIEVMSGSDSNSITVRQADGSLIGSAPLNKGQAARFQLTGNPGATVTSTSPVQVQIIAGNTEMNVDMRGYSVLPRVDWGNDYYAAVPSVTTTDPDFNTDLYIYNPNPTPITISYSDRSGSGTFTVAAGATRSYRDGAGRYVPTNSGVHLTSTNDFWALASCNSEDDTWDWAYSLIPVDYLTTDTFLSWAPGTRTYSAAGSSIYITAVNDNTQITVYNSAGVQICQDVDVDRLESFTCYDPDFDNTGAHIVASDKVAIAWGEDPRRAPTGDPGLDMGYTCLPIPPVWQDVILQVNKTAYPTAVCIGETTTFTINITVPSTSSFTVSNIDLIDTLPQGWEYVNASPEPDSVAGTVISWDTSDWTLNPGQTQTINLVARATEGVDTSIANRNIANATGSFTIGGTTFTLSAEDDAFITIRTDCAKCISGYKIDNCTKEGIPNWTIFLYDETGTALQGSTTTNETGYYQFCDIAPGTYNVTEEVQTNYVNVTNTSIIVKLGSEDILNQNFMNQELLCINGTKIDDCTGEGLNGWTITLTKPDGSKVTDTTNENGDYSFCELVPGIYTVEETVKDGWTNVTPTRRSVTLGCNNVTGQNFVNQKLLCINGTKTVNCGDPGGWTITLYDNENNIIETTTTAAGTGAYSFYNLSSGDYRVAETLKDGWTNDTSYPTTIDVKLECENDNDNNFRNSKLLCIEGYKLNILTNAGVEGWTINLYNAAKEKIESTTTDSTGKYQFCELMPGTYGISEEMRTDWINLTPTSIILELACDNSSGNNFVNRPLPSCCECPTVPDFSVTQVDSLKIQFVDTTTGNLPVEYLWDFGDGATSTDRNPVYQYATPGTKKVTLYVKSVDCDGALSGFVYIEKDIQVTTGEPADSITVAVPNGGEDYKIGEVLPMSWTYTGSPGSTVKIDVFKGPTILKTITGIPIGSSGSGSYSVTIPLSTPVGSDYKIRVTSTSNAAFTDMSDAPFTISTASGASIKVNSPNGGEKWKQGTTQVISWSSTGSPGPTVKIEVLKGTSILKTLTDIPTTSGSISVPVPYSTPLGGDYKIRITSTNNAAYTDTSDAPFSILSAITVIGPDGGEVWTRGSTQVISWSYTGSPGPTVKIEVFKGSTLLKTLANIPISSGSISVPVPMNTPIGNDYSVRISSTSYSACTDTSNGPFSIAEV